MSDAAFENGDAIAAGDQVRGHPFGDDLARVRVIQDNFAIGREKGAIDGARAGPERPRQRHGAVLVGILQADVNDERGKGDVVHPALELCAGDPRDDHGGYCRQPARGVSTAGKCRVRARKHATGV
ncbi:MAG: hypothetical protein M3P13_12830 [Acidobacteriota bacterium]|nr:hypothetical protein [Acidobacteriota bacterium]